jgi:hypothetical protein
MLADQLNVEVTIRELGRQISDRSILGGSDAKNIRSITIHYFERRASNSRVKTRVVPELSEIQPTTPLLRDCMSTAPEKGLQALVYTFGLIVRLQMICSGHLEINIGQLEMFLPQLASEYVITIRDYCLGHAV